MKKLFGTDGIRGVAGKYPLDEKTVKIIGVAASSVLGIKNTTKHPIIIGRDTRKSAPLIAASLEKGLSYNSVDIWDLGVITTPGVAYLVKQYPAAAGIVISASHNPYYNNGIKFFSHQGIKLSDSRELKIEAKIHEIENIASPAFIPQSKNKSTPKRYLTKEYVRFLVSSVNRCDFKGLSIVLDCANGATYDIAPKVFSALGARLHVLNNKPNGVNINKNSGSLHPEKLARYVVQKKAQCGIAFDGDGDRVIFVDEKGVVRDGDFILSILAKNLKDRGKLKKNLLVTTVMANLGLFRAMERHNITVLQTAVGDRYVYEKMKSTGAIVGGEQSGHIIMREYLPTGDGILSALQVLSIMQTEQKSLSELSAVMEKYPQILLNTMVSKKIPIDLLPKTARTIGEAERKLCSDGRILVRYSGTENLLRVMIEGLDKQSIAAMAEDIVRTAQKEIKSAAR